MRLTGISLFVFLCFSLPTSAQHLELGSYSPDGDWSFSVSAYGILASQSTDIFGEGISQSYNDLSSLTNSGLQLNASARYKQWFLHLEGTNTYLESELNALVAVRLDIEQQILHPKIGYQFLDDINYTEEGELLSGWTLQATAGARYWQNDFFLDLDDTPEVDLAEVQQWTDFMVGIRSTIVLGPRVIIGISGDVGGFEFFEESSDFSSTFNFTTCYQLSKSFWINLDFKSFNYDRSAGEGPEEISTKVSVIGPGLGGTFIF